MTFAEPSLLIGLALIPLMALAYSALLRRRRREAAAWANPVLAPALLTAQPGRRRHLPAVLLLPALAALVVALARPERTVAAPQREANVILVMDVSGSMMATDVHPDRLGAAVAAAKVLIDQLPPGFRVGLIAFSDAADQPVAPTTDHGEVKAALDQLQPGGGTAIGDALQRALVSARTPVPTPNGAGLRRIPSAIVLLSDGKNNEGSADPLAVARQARGDHIPIDTIALGSPGGVVQLRDSFGFVQSVAVPPDPAGLRRIAELAGGRAFTAAQAGRLRQIYAGIGSGLSSRQVKQEITAAFVALAVALLLLSGVLSLRWFGRLLPA